jgi:hypothetical protein
VKTARRGSDVPLEVEVGARRRKLHGSQVRQAGVVVDGEVGSGPPQFTDCNRDVKACTGQDAVWS